MPNGARTTFQLMMAGGLYEALFAEGTPEGNDQSRRRVNYCG